MYARFNDARNIRNMTSGLHHITLITRKVQANVDFYAGFLGLRLIKRTAGFEDATQLHLFYGDAEAMGPAKFAPATLEGVVFSVRLAVDS